MPGPFLPKRLGQSASEVISGTPTTAWGEYRDLNSYHALLGGFFGVSPLCGHCRVYHTA